MIIIGCVGHERPLSSLCRSPPFCTRLASAPVTPEAASSSDRLRFLIAQ